MKIVVEIKPTLAAREKVANNRRKIIEAIDNAIKETEILEEGEYSVYLTFQQ